MFFTWVIVGTHLDSSWIVRRNFYFWENSKNYPVRLMKFLSIKEAQDQYDTSRTTLTRLANKHKATKDVEVRKRKFYISTTLLDKHFPQSTHSDNTDIQSTQMSTQNNHTQNASSKTENRENTKDVDLVKFLQDQITEKDVQLREKDKQIDKLLQRQSEQNIIIQTMQNRFEGLQNGIDNGVKLLSEKTKETNRSHKSTDNGFTIASAILILLAVALLVVFLIYK